MLDEYTHFAAAPEDALSHEEFVKLNRKKMLRKVIPGAIIFIAIMIFVLIRAFGDDLSANGTCDICGKKAHVREIKDNLGKYTNYCDDCWEDKFK